MKKERLILIVLVSIFFSVVFVNAADFDPDDSDTWPDKLTEEQLRLLSVDKMMTSQITIDKIKIDDNFLKLMEIDKIKAESFALRVFNEKRKSIDSKWFKEGSASEIQRIILDEEMVWQGDILVGKDKKRWIDLTNYPMAVSEIEHKDGWLTLRTEGGAVYSFRDGTISLDGSVVSSDVKFVGGEKGKVKILFKEGTEISFDGSEFKLEGKGLSVKIGKYYVQKGEGKDSWRPGKNLGKEGDSSFRVVSDDNFKEPYFLASDIDLLNENGKLHTRIPVEFTNKLMDSFSSKIFEKLNEIPLTAFGGELLEEYLLGLDMPGEAKALINRAFEIADKSTGDVIRKMLTTPATAIFLNEDGKVNFEALGISQGMQILNIGKKEGVRFYGRGFYHIQDKDLSFLDVKVPYYLRDLTIQEGFRVYNPKTIIKNGRVEISFEGDKIFFSRPVREAGYSIDKIINGYHPKDPLILKHGGAGFNLDNPSGRWSNFRISTTEIRAGLFQARWDIAGIYAYVDKEEYNKIYQKYRKGEITRDEFWNQISRISDQKIKFETHRRQPPRVYQKTASALRSFTEIAYDYVDKEVGETKDQFVQRASQTALDVLGDNFAGDLASRGIERIGDSISGTQTSLGLSKTGEVFLRMVNSETPIDSRVIEALESQGVKLPVDREWTYGDAAALLYLNTKEGRKLVRDVGDGYSDLGTYPLILPGRGTVLKKYSSVEIDSSNPNAGFVYWTNPRAGKRFEEVYDKRATESLIRLLGVSGEELLGRGGLYRSRAIGFTTR